jgi:hypothetical protein
MSAPTVILRRLEHLYLDEITVKKRTGNDIDGYPEYEPVGTNYKARVTGKITNVLGPDGQVHVTKIMVQLTGPWGITTEDQVIVPVRFARNPRETNPTELLESRTYEPIAVKRATGREGPSHEVLYL